MFDQHDPRQLDESGYRMHARYNPSGRTNLGGSLIALAIIGAVVLGAIWVAVS